MPTISMFYGILVAMMFRDNERHNLPHIHVRYAGEKASVAIEDGRVLAGSLPTKQMGRWCRLGLKSTRTSYSQIGSLPLLVKNPSGLHRFSKRTLPWKPCWTLFA